MNLRLRFIQQIGLFTQLGMLVEIFYQWNKNNSSRDNTELSLHISSNTDQLFPYLYQEHQAQYWDSIIRHQDNKPLRIRDTVGIYQYFFCQTFVKKSAKPALIVYIRV